MRKSADKITAVFRTGGLQDYSMENNMIVIEELAKVYPQLYLPPCEESIRLYPEIVLRGRPAPAKELAHFHCSPVDDCHMIATPAGEVRTVTLGNRCDFVTFLQIMGNRCVPVSVPDTQGAVFLDGVINREVPFMPKKDALIVLSIAPYSGVPAEELGFGAEEWLAYSHTIRLYHECTHFICYRLHPGARDAVRDELTADAVGIIAAFGKYDRTMAERFLGIGDGRYIGGRLENYTAQPEAILPAIDRMLTNIEQKARENAHLTPMELAICLDNEI